MRWGILVFKVSVQCEEKIEICVKKNLDFVQNYLNVNPFDLSNRGKPSNHAIVSNFLAIFFLILSMGGMGLNKPTYLW